MANVITCIRIVCAVLMIFSPTFSKLFFVYYLTGGLSDVLDGFVARNIGKQTELGARLDTLADIVFVIIALVKLISAIYVPHWQIIWILCIAIIKCVGIIYGFAVYKHFVSEHTVLNKCCGIVLYVIPFIAGLFSQKALSLSITATCILATAAATQEGYYILKGKEIS